MKNQVFTVVVFSAFVFLIGVNIATAANCRVTKAADSNDGVCDAGDCSLREAVAEPTCAAIDFSLDLAGQPVSLTLGEIRVDRSVSIDGPGADAFTITAGGLSRIFTIASNVTANIGGLTLTGGTGDGLVEFGSGGAIMVKGALNLNEVVLKQNSACATCFGSAVFFANGSGTSTIRNSTVTDNPASDIWPAGAIAADGAGFLQIENSTLAFNPGPAVYMRGAPVRIIDSTVISNGMGVYVNGLGNLMFANSVLLDIYRVPGPVIVQSEGFNIVRTAVGSPALNYQGSDRENIDPQLGPLAFNGGHTRTMAPLAGSPAIDTGSDERAAFYSVTADQRGVQRVFDGDGNGTATVDVGAVELNAPAPAPVTVAGRVLGAVSGNPLRSQNVTLVDFQGHSYSTLSSSLGWFVFSGLPKGFVYRISVAARRGPQVKTVFAGQDLTDADILIPGL